MRIAALALAALFLATASAPAPEQGNSAIEQQRGSDAQEAANTIASAISNTVQPVAKDEGCQDRSDKRNSDLCAQWKAADAARDAATIAFWGLLLSLFGTGLLFWTFRETRLTSRRELRAYISARPLGLKIIDGGSGGMIIGLKVRNGGQTPAYGTAWSGNVVALDAETAPLFFEPANDGGPIGEIRPCVIHGGTDIDSEIRSTDPFGPAQMAALAAGALDLYAYGIVEYRDVFKRTHQTTFCFVLERGTLARAGQKGPDGKPITSGEIAWDQASFFNDAT